MGLKQARETVQKLGAHDGAQSTEERNPAAGDTPSEGETGDCVDIPAGVNRTNYG